MQIRRSLKWLILLPLAAALLLAGLGYGLLQTAWGKHRVTILLEDLLQAKITGLSGSLPFSPSAESLILQDSQGGWLRIEGLDLRWRPAFFPLTWHVQQARAEKIHILRAPAAEAETAPAESSGFTFSGLPRLAIHRIDLPYIAIDPALGGGPQTLAAEGAIILLGDAAQGTQFTLRSLTGPATRLDIKAALQAAEPVIAIDLDEAAGGIAGALLELGAHPLQAGARLRLGRDGALHLDSMEIASPVLEAALTGTIATPFDAPAFRLAADLKHLQNMPATLARLSGGALHAEMTGSWAGDILTLSALTVQGRHMRLTGKGLSLDGAALGGELNLSVPAAEYLHPDLRGGLTAATQLSGTLAAPQAHLTAALHDGGKSLDLSAQIRMEKNLLRLSGLTGRTSGLELTGDVVYDMAAALAEGKLQLAAADLAGLNPFLQSAMQGKGAAQITLEKADRRQQARAEGALSGFSYDGTQIDTLDFQLRAADLNNLQNIDANLKAKRIVSGSTVIDTLALQAKNSGETTNLALQASSATPLPFAIRAEAALKTALPDWTMQIAVLEGTLDGHRLLLPAPALIKNENSGIAVTGLDLTIGKGALRVSGLYSRPRVKIDIAMQRLPLALLTDRQYDGTQDGVLQITGTPARPRAAFDLRTTGLVAAARDSAEFALHAKGALTPEQLTLRADLNTQGTLYAEMRLPARFALDPFALALPPEQPLSGKLVAHAEASPLFALLLPPDQAMTGRIDGALTLGGTLSAPKPSGKLVLSDARYENRGTGTLLEAIATTVNIRRDQLVIEQGSARAGEGGVTLSGTAGLASPYPLALRLAFRDALLIDNQQASGSVNGAMQLTGPAAAPRITGKLIPGPMEIRLPEATGVDVPEIRIRNPAALPGQPWQDEETRTAPAALPIPLDLAIQIPGRVFVRGRGIETEMRGNLRIGGTASAPDIAGKLRTVRGTFTLLDRQLNITEGALTFRGAMPPSPYLQMTAETRTQALTATVRVEGPVRAPELTLTSTPPRPEDEILAHILFGRELKSITPMQGLQLAQAIQTLRGGGPGLDLLGKARNLLGVDRLNVGETSGGSLGVGAGKYISDKIYVGVEGGAEPQSGKVKAEIEVSKRFSVETETGARSSGVRFNWKRDY